MIGVSHNSNSLIIVKEVGEAFRLLLFERWGGAFVIQLLNICIMSGTNQSSSSSRDPYTILGLDHNASPTQIKVAYRKLALQYHPDRQLQQQEQSEQQQQEATDKFAEISSAYAILSDPTKKSQYDHLYKFGAFDDGSDPISEMRDDANDSYRNHATSSSGYKYTENLSGGYYTNKATSTSNNNNTSSSSTAPSPPPFFSFVELRKQDSFFDELLHSPKNKTSSSSSPFQNNSEQHQQQHDQQPRTNDTNNGAQQQQQQQQPKQHPKRSGIGFSVRPMGKHLSIHVPSKAEIMTSMASGEPLPLFGTRVTFSTSKSLQKRRTLISTTTRIAHGQQRTVKRTVYIQPDGKKEEIIEENGVVKRRHVEELCPPQPPPSPSSAAVGGGGKGKEAHQTQQQRKGLQEKQAASSCTGWHSGVICGLRDCVLGPCLGV